MNIPPQQQAAHDGSIPARLEALKRELAELKASLPRHSVQATQLIRIEELEETIAALEASLNGPEGQEAASLPA